MEDSLQKEAIITDSGPALILAGPGSGKTYVLTHHIKYLIDNGVLPESIMVITFTKAAAKEMQSRFFKLLPNAASKVVFGTFHSVFLKILKIFKPHIPDIISNSKRKEIIDNLTMNTDLSDVFSNRISLYKSLCNKDLMPFSGEKDKNEFMTVYEGYNTKLLLSGYIDFDDILYEFYNLCVYDKHALSLIQNNFKYVCLDEFQDINEIQYTSIKLLFSHTQNIYAVGDEDQAIYGFRGSTPGIMNKFLLDYKNTKVVELENNYRSKSEIIDAAITVISKNPDRLKNKRQICVFDDKSKAFHLNAYFNRSREFSDLIYDICNVPDKESIAILCRTNKDVLEYRNILMQESSDTVPGEILLLQALYSYTDYILTGNKNSLIKILNIPNRNLPINILKDNNMGLQELIKRYTGSYKGHNLTILNNQLNLLSKMTPITFCLYLNNVLNIEHYYLINGLLSKERFDKQYEIIEKAAKESIGLSDFKAKLDGLINRNEEIKAEHIDRNISITTFHQSKGLEYDNVFIPDVYEGKIPSGLSVSECNVEEERRLFYVAMTRAKNNLFIYTISNEESGGHIPSRFLSDLM